MKLHRFFAAAATFGILAAALPAFCQSSDEVTAQTVVTVLGKNSERPATPQARDFKVQVNGKAAPITDLVPLRGDRAGLEFVILIDNSVRTSLGRQMNEIAGFIQALPPATQVGIAYMGNGRAVFAQPFTADKAQAARSLHLPAGTAGSNASPYFCLSDLARNWPSGNRENRREVLMITSGVDPYNLRFDPDNPYLQSAINDSIRAGLIVHSIYWADMGRIGRSGYESNAGQSLLNLVGEATGGRAYFQGFGNPVSFDPFFEDLNRRLQNQYELGFSTQAKSKPEIQPIKVKLEMPNTKIDAAQRVLIAPGGVAQR